MPGFARAAADSLVWGTKNGTQPQKESWAEHQSWMAAARWFFTTINRMMVSAAGRALGGRRGWGGICGEEVYLSFWAAN